MKTNYTHINQFSIDFDFSAEKDLKSFKEETLSYLSEVTQGKEITLIFSGGNDSRFIARSLMELNLPFKAITNSFERDFSDYDSIVSHEYCIENKIKHERKFLNERKFFERLKEIAHHRGYIYTRLICYYIQHLIEEAKDSGYRGIFFSGCGMEIHVHQDKKDENKSLIEFNPHPHMLLEKNSGTLYSLWSDRIFLSYINDNEFISNYKQCKSGYDWTIVRDKIFKKCYPDLKLEKKTLANDSHMHDYFTNKIMPWLMTYDVYKFMLERYEFDIDQYFNERNLLS